MSALISARRDSARDTSRTLVPARSASCSRVAVITPVSNSAYERTPSQTAKVTPGRGPDMIRFKITLERSCESMVYSHGFRWATYALGLRAVNTTVDNPWGKVFSGVLGDTRKCHRWHLSASPLLRERLREIHRVFLWLPESPTRSCGQLLGERRLHATLPACKQASSANAAGHAER